MLMTTLARACPAPQPRDGQMSGFEFALDLILDGLERARDGL
jgi:hypothetical protein